MLISVIIPTFNPSVVRLNRTLEALRQQNFPLEEWELIIVDNNSSNKFSEMIDLTWHPSGKIIFEANQGLTYARLKGYEESTGSIIILVDDDNLLETNYLALAAELFHNNPALGVAGGNSIGEFEEAPEKWAEEFLGMIAVRSTSGNPVVTSDLRNGYPSLAPIGAGMCIRRDCFQLYYTYIKEQKEVIKDRTGNSLSSGGDNEINIVALKNEFAVGFFPELTLVHLIPKARVQFEYLKRLNYASSMSWIELLRKHQICPWPAISPLSVHLRMFKSYFTYKAWKHPVNMIRWRGACGSYKALARASQ